MRFLVDYKDNMNLKIIKFRNLFIHKLTGIDVVELRKQSWQIDDMHKDVKYTKEHLTNQYNSIISIEERNFQLLKSFRDDIPAIRNKLYTLRNSAEYKNTFANKNPLVSVRIASYENTEKLINTAIASVLNQTYQNFEIVIVNDGPNDKTKRAIERLNDNRVRYYEFPFRNIYPEKKEDRWMVAGSPGMNFATNLSNGEWIAPLDEDDEFSPDHIQKLLQLALVNKFEMVYGAASQIDISTGNKKKIYSFPPSLGSFSMQAALYMKQISFIEYDQESWLVDEPGDWNLCRRMLMSGVHIGSTEEVVSTLHMTPIHKKDK